MPRKKLSCLQKRHFEKSGFLMDFNRNREIHFTMTAHTNTLFCDFGRHQMIFFPNLYVNRMHAWISIYSFDLSNMSVIPIPIQV